MDFSAARVAEAAGGRLVEGDPDAPGPRRAVIDSRAVEPGDLFVGLRGEHADGGTFAAQAIERGAWGVLVTPDHAAGTAIVADDPLRAMQFLAREWRRELACPTIAITGS